MDLDRIMQLLAQVASGERSVEDAANILERLPFGELAEEDSHVEARVDHHRTLRTGFPEVVFCLGKTASQVRSIAREILDHGNVLARHARNRRSLPGGVAVRGRRALLRGRQGGRGGQAG